MKKVNQLISKIAILLILISSLSSYAQDWPQWRGVNRDGKTSGFIIPEKWPTELTQQWKVNVGASDATLVIVKNKLYSFSRQGSDEVLQCFDAGTGKSLWVDKYAAQAVVGPPSSHPGPRSTPIISDGKIVTLGVGGVLSCLDANNGKVLWRKDNITDALPSYYTAMSPIVINGMCIAHLGGKDNGQVIAFDLATGDEKWKWTGDGPAYTSPDILTAGGVKQLVLLTEKNLVGLDAATGKFLWQVATPLQSRYYNSASPVIDGQTVIYTGQGTGTRAVKITKQGDKFVANDVWSNPELGTKWNTPVLKDGFLYGISDGRKLFCMNAGTGETAWIDDAMHSDFGTTIDAGTVLVALPSTANLIIYKPDPKIYSELARYKVSDTPVYSYPVISGNRIFVKDAETLMMFEIQ